MRLNVFKWTAALGLCLAVMGCNIPLQPPVDQTATVQAAEALVKTLETGATQTAQPAPPTLVPTPVVPTETPTTAATSTCAPQSDGAPLVVTPQNIKDETQQPPIITDITYPVFTKQDGSPVAGLNQEVQNLIAGLRQAVQESSAQITPIPDVQTGPNSLNTRFEVTYNDGNLVSIYFQVSTYSQGAAHPFPFSETITYDVSQDRRLELSDLFQPGSDYLPRLSKLSIEELKRQQMLGWEDGALPKPENYQNWNIMPEGLRITFDPYQVNAYASGYQKVVLPWETLGDILNPAYQVGS